MAAEGPFAAFEAARVAVAVAYSPRRLRSAARNGDLEEVQALIRQGHSVDGAYQGARDRGFT